jgi:hypothetical protein
MTGRGIDVGSAAGETSCPRCGQPGILSARVPYGWERGDGQRTNGTTIVVLCSRCDAGTPAAGALITFFHVHGHVTEETVQQCAELLQAWADSLEVPNLDLDALNSEVAAWRQGEPE